MRRLGVLAAVAAACGLLVASGTGTDKPNPDPRADALDLVLAADVPQRLQLTVTFGGKSVPAAWDEVFAAIHAFFDRDGDGTLGTDEAARLPSAFALRQVLWGRFMPDGVGGPLMSDLDADGDDSASKAELADYYRRRGLGGVLVGVGRMPAADRLTDALLKALARKDGTVGEAEWKAAATTLAKLDRNGDDLIGPGELVEKTAYPGATGSVLLAAPAEAARPDALADAFPLVVLPLRPADVFWQTSLAARREKAKQAPADVSTLRRDKPAVAWSVTLGDKADDARRVHAAGGCLVELRVDGGKLPTLAADARRRTRSAFDDRDADGDGVLDAKELAATLAVPFLQLLPAADRDGDGKLSSKELSAWLDLQQRVADAHVLLTIVDHGSGLFEFLDADRDGAVSVRELRTAWSRLKAAGCIGPGGLDRAKLPRHLFAVVSRGHPLSPIGTPARPGPAWFLATDRNGDGDISAREWIGEPELFRKIDVDGDGLLSAEEAEKVVTK